VAGEADIDTGRGMLLLGGSLRGKYEDGLIDLNCQLGLRGPFTYTQGKVTARLLSGNLGLEVERSQFKKAEIRNVVAEADIDTGRGMLYLGGSLSGKYENDVIDVDCSLGVRQPFVYTQGSVTVTLRSGNLRVKIEQSQFKFAALENVVIDVTVTTDQGPLTLRGQVSGKYENELIDFEGAITLLTPYSYTMGSITATLQSGTVRVKVERSEFQWAALENVVATVNITVGDKNVNLRGTITNGKYHKNGKIDLDCSLALVSPVPLLQSGNFNVTLTSASVGVKVNQSVLQEINASGRADVSINAGRGNQISGYLDVRWRNAGGQNTFSGTGRLDVSMANGKVTGNVAAELFENGNWRINGTVTFKLTSWAEGEIGMEMDQTLDPVLSGTLRVTNAELYPGRDLLRQNMVICPPVAVNIYGVNFGVGCDASLAVVLNPVRLNASIGFRNFRPLRMNVPEFTASADVTAGLAVEAAIVPYLFLALGGGSLLAGIKLEGKVMLRVPVEVTAGASLHGDGQKFGGELRAGVSIKPSLTLSIQPKLFAQAGSMRAEHPIMDAASYTFPDLFTFEWGKTYKFGDEGQSTEGGSAGAQQETGGSATQETQAQTQRQVQSQSPRPGATVEQDKPQIGAEEEQEGEGGGEANEMQEKMREMQEYAENIGKLATLVGFVVDVVVIGLTLSFLGPAGWLVAIVIAMIKNGVGPAQLAEGFEALVWFIGKLAAFIWSLMPDWFQAAWQRIKALIDMGAQGAAREVSKSIKEWGASFSAPWGEIFEPLINWCADRASAFILAFDGFTFSPLGFIKLMLNLMMAAASSIVSLISAVSESISRLVKLVRHLCHTGKIVATCTDPEAWGKNPWYVYVNIPGLMEGFSLGPSSDTGPWAAGNALARALRDVFGCTPNTNLRSDWGFDYR
jgi:hypothetical protein